MEKKIRHSKYPSNLFNPNHQGLTTYDLTYVTAKTNRRKNEELQLSINKNKTRKGFLYE